MKQLSVVALFALLVAGCASGVGGAEPDVAVSAACDAAVADLDALDTADVAVEDAAILASLSACGSADEYVAAVREHPGSWYFKDADAVDAGVVLSAACAVEGAGVTRPCE